MRIFEYRGVKGLVAAEIIKDDTDGFVTGTPFPVAGSANISVEVDNSSETHFYDNFGAIIINTEGNTTVTIEASALEPEIYANITGYQYNPYTGAVIEGKRQVKYFAIGYQYEDVGGDVEHEYVRWFYKGQFSIPSATHVTMNNSTDANGQTLTYTAIRTTYKFNSTNDGAKSMAIDSTLGLVDVTNFFAQVTTPDTVTPLQTYVVTKNVGAGTTLSVQNVVSRAYVDSGDSVPAGSQLLITATGGTIEVNDTQFISGNIHVVTGATTISTIAE